MHKRLHNHDVWLIAAADRGYAVQLDVMLTSVRRHLPSHCRLVVRVLSEDLSPVDLRWANRGPDDEVEYVAPAICDRKSLPLRHGDHVSVATYYRLFLADVVPKNIRRVIYLDSDLVVLDDLSRLAGIDLKGRTIGAVRSFSAPYLRQAGPAFSAVPCSDNSPYFNAGVLLIDTVLWRQRQVKERALDFLRKNTERVLFWDQDALNSVLVDDWMELDLRWNRTSDFHHHDRMKPPQPFSLEQWQSLARPYVAHFVSGYKPWTHFRHPDKKLYDRYLREAGHGRHRMTMWRALSRRLHSIIART